jgi:hypothetical protein
LMVFYFSLNIYIKFYNTWHAVIIWQIPNITIKDNNIDDYMTKFR